MVTISAEVGAAGAIDDLRRTVGGRWYSRNAAVLAYGLAAAAVLIGWLLRARSPLSAEAGVGYWLGIIGASLMAFLLLYPVRKRVRFMRVFGSTATWFRIHIFFGVVGPILILYHCNFGLGSLNARVALFCTLLVAISGLFGRYIYSKVHFGLSGHKASLQELTARARLTAEQQTYTAAFVPDLLELMGQFDRMVLKPPETALGSALLPLELAVKTRWAALKLNRFVRRQLRAQALLSDGTAHRHKSFEAVMRKFIAEHLRRVRRVAEFGFYERVFSLWHLFHLPFFYMLVLTATVHVFAVHMY